jgi:O-acetyl-ADP-ribose deacetylase (regulator of RNase III)
MDGGIDGKLRDFFGIDIEKAVRDKISKEYCSELPVGSVIIVQTGYTQFKYLVSHL